VRQVGVNSLKIGDVLEKTIYSSSGRILLGKGVKLTPLYISRLKDMGISAVYIEDDRYDDVVVEDVISEENRRSAMQIIEDCSQAVRLGKDIDGFELKSIVNKIVEQILFKKDILVTMMDMRTRDNHLFAHSVNVCVLAVILGKALHLEQEKLETLGAGALLHDIGMVHLDSTLWGRGGGLTRQEIEQLRTHTIHGFEDLRKRKDISIVAAHVAFQHHENIDGTGYPRRLKEVDIHPLAQVVAVVDFFDRLTSDHSDLKKTMPHEACEILMGLAGKMFNLEMVRLFLKNIAAYPTGITVRLNTGEIGVVVDQNPSMPARPVVRVFDEPEAGEATAAARLGPGQFKEYDMVQHRTIFIKEVLS